VYAPLGGTASTCARVGALASEASPATMAGRSRPQKLRRLSLARLAHRRDTAANPPLEPVSDAGLACTGAR
jgi:hypothetical protein